MSVSPLYLLLQHSPFKTMKDDDLQQIRQAVMAAQVDPQEQVKSLSALDQFIQSTPKRDTLFAHDVIRDLLQKGVRATATLSNEKSERKASTKSSSGNIWDRAEEPGSRSLVVCRPLTYELLRLGHASSVPHQRLEELRLGCALMDEVYKLRGAAATLAAIDELLDSGEWASTIDGLSPRVWLAAQSNPDVNHRRTVRGWEFEGSESERTNYGLRVIRSLHSQVLKQADVAPVEQWVMDIVLLAWVKKHGTHAARERAAASVLERWGDTDHDTMLDYTRKASEKMAAMTGSPRARSSLLFVWASGALAKYSSGSVNPLATGLLFHGLNLAHGLDERPTVDFPSVPDHPKAMIKDLVQMEGGARLALGAWPHGNPPSLQWLQVALEKLEHTPEQLLQAVKEAGPKFEKLLEKYPAIQAQVRKAVLSCSLAPSAPSPRSRLRM